MAPDSKTLRSIVTTVLMLLIGLLVLQALGYGVGFVVDPESGVDGFGYEDPTVVNDLTVTLVGFVGVGMLGSAAFLTLSAFLIWRSNRVGTYMTTIVGGIYVLTGMQAFRAEWGWDAYFYAIAGISLIVLSVAVRWLQSRERGAHAN